MGHEVGRQRPEEGRGAQLRDPQAPARVRRGDERAADVIYDYRQQVLRGEDLRELCRPCSIRRSVGPWRPIARRRRAPPSGTWTSSRPGTQRKTGRDAPDFPRESRAGDPSPSVDRNVVDLYDERTERLGKEQMTIDRALRPAERLRHEVEGAPRSTWTPSSPASDCAAYANEDPKVAYKREGYQLFEEMLKAIEDEVSDLMFLRVEVPRPRKRTRP